MLNRHLLLVASIIIASGSLVDSAAANGPRHGGQRNNGQRHVYQQRDGQRTDALAAARAIRDSVDSLQCKTRQELHCSSLQPHMLKTLSVIDDAVCSLEKELREPCLSPRFDAKLAVLERRVCRVQEVFAMAMDRSRSGFDPPIPCRQEFEIQFAKMDQALRCIRRAEQHVASHPHRFQQREAVYSNPALRHSKSISHSPRNQRRHDHRHDQRSGVRRSEFERPLAQLALRMLLGD